MKRILVLVILFVLAAGVATAIRYVFVPTTPEEAIKEDTGTISGDPVFEWTYASSSDMDIPYSKISLVARYPDGSIRTKDIDTIAGGCNAYGEADADVYEKSTMIICYYAGLGHYYKVVEDAGRYLVQRKTFEEASPEYNPPPEQFETIAEF